jgi:hypothetical protein
MVALDICSVKQQRQKWDGCIGRFQVRTAIISAKVKKQIQQENAHVLFISIVGYLKPRSRSNTHSSRWA